MHYLKLSNSQKQRVNSSYPGLERGGYGELLFNRHRVSVWGDERVLEIDSDDGCTTMSMSLFVYFTVHFEMVKMINLVTI